MTLARSFKEAGFSTELRTPESDDPVSGMLILSEGFGNPVELLVGFRNMDPAIFSRTTEVKFSGSTLSLIGREDFIAMKCYADSPLDLFDARSAYEEAPSSLNLDLLRTVTRRLGRETADHLEEILAGA